MVFTKIGEWNPDRVVKTFLFMENMPLLRGILNIQWLPLISQNLLAMVHDI